MLAGGRSSRFGRDKAKAHFEGRPLLEHVRLALAAQCDAVVVCGRDWPGQVGLRDVPRAGIGPLAGVCAALQHASAQRFAAVLTSPCDTIGLPDDLAHRLSPGPSHVADQWLVALWPAQLAAVILHYLQEEGRFPVSGLLERVSSRAVPVPGLRNINTPGDLSA